MSTADVKVDVVATGAGVPKHAKLAQILSILVSGVIALAVSSVLADGQSVIILKPVKDLPPATNPALKDLVSHKTVNKYGEFTDKYVQLKWNLAELLGPGYGVGLHHDQSGHIWNEAGAEDQDLAFLIKDLGIDAVMAAVPSVISTDGESRAQLARVERLPFSPGPTVRLTLSRCPPTQPQASSTRCTSWAARASSALASPPCRSASSRRSSPWSWSSSTRSCSPVC